MFRMRRLTDDLRRCYTYRKSLLVDKRNSSNTLIAKLTCNASVFPGNSPLRTALAISDFIKESKNKITYRILTSFGLTPWLSLHLFYIMILFLFSWLNGNGYADIAMTACEALFKHLSWIVTLSEVFMLAAFIYWFYLQIRKKTVFPRAAAFTNILIIYAVMYIIKTVLPESPFRLGFTNGLISESMII